MSITGGWGVLKGHVDGLLNDLDSLNDQAIESGAGFEEIGRNTLIINMTKGIIKRMLDKVEDAKDSCENDKTK